MKNTQIVTILCLLNTIAVEAGICTVSALGLVPRGSKRLIFETTVASNIDVCCHCNTASSLKLLKYPVSDDPVEA
jgi:hypothetical protein